uniref:Uncharacterized protein n=1 Tax=Rhodosorus marinus TaxID=101924 RepID=A0A7S2ZJS7_9RHOD|mmetsp:Transcript_21986/g.89308  ORF Transcript_21986/g.89308 Transcript_21986/m.89308 type:complete len:464 (+) Transcript_21986:266-1657(+)
MSQRRSHVNGLGDGRFIDRRLARDGLSAGGRREKGWQVRLEVEKVVQRAKRVAFSITVLIWVILGFIAVRGKAWVFVGTLAAGSAIAEAGILSGMTFSPEVHTRWVRTVRQILRPPHLLQTALFSLAGCMQSFSLAVVFKRQSIQKLDFGSLQHHLVFGAVLGALYSLDDLLNDRNVVKIILPHRFRIYDVVMSSLREARRAISMFATPCSVIVLLLSSSSSASLRDFPLLIATGGLMSVSWSLCRDLMFLLLTAHETEFELDETLSAAERAGGDPLVQTVCFFSLRSRACESAASREAFFEDPTGRVLDLAIRLAIAPVKHLNESVLASTERQGLSKRRHIRPIFWDSSRVQHGIEIVAELLVSSRAEDRYGLALAYIPVILDDFLSLYEALLLYSRNAKSFEEDAEEKAQETSVLDTLVCGTHRLVHEFRPSFTGYLQGKEPRWNSELSQSLEKFLRYQEL